MRFFVCVFSVQLYEWVMELIESRKAYMDEQGNPLGLLFVKQDKSKPQVFHLCTYLTSLFISHSISHSISLTHSH